MNRDVGVGQLVDDLQQRGDRLPFEVGAFVALEACEGLLQDAVRLNPDDIRVTLEGSVVVSPEAERTGPDEAARSLVSVLSRLLVAAGPGVPPSLAKIVEDGSLPNSQQDLQRLHDLIEASLIPLNRGASRRILARLVRESERPPAAVPAIEAEELDAELDALLQTGLETKDTELLDPSPKAALRRSANADIDPVESEAVTLPGSVAAAVPERDYPAPDSHPEVVTATIPTVDASDETEGAARETATATFSVPAPETGPKAAVGAATAPESAIAAVEGSDSEMAVPEPEMVIGYESLDEAEPETLIGYESLDEAEPETLIGHEPADEAEPEALETLLDDERVTVAGAQPGASNPEVGTGAALGYPSEPVPSSLSASAAEPPAEPVTAKYPVPRQASDAADPSASRKELPGAPSAETRQQQAASRGAVDERGTLASKTDGRPWRAVLLIALAAVALFGLTQSGAFDALLTPTPPAEQVTPATGEIRITVFPEDAQVFVFEGRGPVVAEGLPVEGPHEFVVFDRGLEPSRAFVPPGARWLETDQGPLYELAVQTVPSTDDTGAILELGPPLSEGHASSEGPVGRVRVVTNPPEAKVYRFIGLGPEVAIDARSIQEGQEILAFHPDYASRRAVIGPSDWRSSEGRYEAAVEIRLPRSGSSRAVDAP